MAWTNYVTKSFKIELKNVRVITDIFKEIENSSVWLWL